MKLINETNFKKKTKLIILAIACISIFLFSYCTTMIDLDFFFHFDAGRYFFETGKIPTIAISTWYGQENNIAWISHEWLFGIICYIAGQNLGLLPFISGAIMTAIISFALFSNSEVVVDHPIKTLVLVAMICLATFTSAVMRPQLCLYFFTLCLYKLIKSEIEKPSKKIYLLIPLTIAWVNLHGGSYILLFFFSSLFFILDAIKFKWGRLSFNGCAKEVTKRRFITLLISVFTVCLNGHGLEMYTYPFTNLSDIVMLSSIQEWQPINLFSLEIIMLIAPICLIMKMILEEEKYDIVDFLFIVAFIAMTLKSVRFATQCNILTLAIFPRYFKTSKYQLKNIYLILLPMITLIILFKFFTNAPSVYTKPFDDTFIPENNNIVIQQLEIDKPKHLFNDYNVGGYLTYKKIPTFIDGRADIFSKYNFEDYTAIIRCYYGFEELLEKYNFDAFYIQRDTNLYSYLKDNPKYELVIEDNSYSYFK